MTSIGSGPSLGFGPKLDVNAASAAGTADARAVAASPPAVAAQGAQVAQAATQVATRALDAGPVPVDTDRVATIKKAIESGTYPILPTKISDAMIAAGLLLRVAK